MIYFRFEIGNGKQESGVAQYSSATIQVTNSSAYIPTYLTVDLRAVSCDKMTLVEISTKIKLMTSQSLNADGQMHPWTYKKV